jgi:hypothetical protein
MSEGNFNEKEKLVKGPRLAPDTKTDWPTDCRSQINFNFNFESALHVAMHASHAALPMVSLEILHCTNLTSKDGDLAFQVGGVSDETAIYGREFCGTST